MAKAALYCVKCGTPQFHTDVTSCTQCGAENFVEEPPPVSWDLALTHNDKLFLKSIRVKTERSQ